MVSDGEAYIAGVNGPTFANLKAGDVVYPYDETKKILKNSRAGGKLSGPFPAFYGGGTAGGLNAALKYNGINSGTVNYTDNSTTNYNYNSGSGSSSSSSAEDEFDWVDWIEIKLSRVERLVNNLKKTAESTYKTLKQRTVATNKEISKVSEEITVQEKAYKRYLKQANSVGLSTALKKRVQSGTIDINKYSEATRELISEYQKW